MNECDQQTERMHRFSELQPDCQCKITIILLLVASGNTEGRACDAHKQKGCQALTSVDLPHLVLSRGYRRYAIKASLLRLEQWRSVIEWVKCSLRSNAIHTPQELTEPADSFKQFLMAKKFHLKMCQRTSWRGDTPSIGKLCYRTRKGVLRKI